MRFIDTLPLTIFIGLQKGAFVWLARPLPQCPQAEKGKPWLCTVQQARSGQPDKGDDDSGDVDNDDDDDHKKNSVYSQWQGEGDNDDGDNDDGGDVDNDTDDEHKKNSVYGDNDDGDGGDGDIDDGGGGVMISLVKPWTFMVSITQAKQV